jgi:SAM-dependent MidA family methyltransferase
LQIADLIRERGPMTVAAFIELALYHPEFGYYTRAARRSGRAGDFLTSVDVGPLFGELLAVQLSEMFTILEPPAAGPQRPLDLIEAGAGNGRLSADILTAARAYFPDLYRSIRLHLVEVSPAARKAQARTLASHADKLVWSDSTLPDTFEGVLIANELLDALPVHQVVMREHGLREVYVTAARGACRRRADSEREEAGGCSRASTSDELALVEGPPSTPALGDYLARLGVELEPGWCVEINLRALDWICKAARRLRRGFIIVIDYGHGARDLYSASHSSGTLTTFRRHRSVGAEGPGAPEWLRSPGEQDITSHVDFTSLRAVAESEDLQTLGYLDQTYFLLGLLPPDIGDRQSIQSDGDSIRIPHSAVRSLKTLILPGGLGSTHKVMIFGRAVGTPSLRGCSYRMRVT